MQLIISKKNGGFDNAVGSYEKFIQHLIPMQNMLTIPIVIIGLDSLENHSIFNKNIYCNEDLLPIKSEDKKICIIQFFKENNIKYKENYIIKEKNIIASIKIVDFNLYILNNKSDFNKIDDSLKDRNTFLSLKDIYSLNDIMIIIKKYQESEQLST